MTSFRDATPLQRKLYLEHRARIARLTPKRPPPDPPPLKLARVEIVVHYEADGPVRVKRPDSTLLTLLRDVAKRHEFDPPTLKSDLKHGPVVHARNEFCYLAALKTRSSLESIARFICKDHATVHYAIAAHALRFSLPLPRNMQPKTYLGRLARSKEEWQKRKRERLNSAESPTA
jgi:DnaA-like protein